MERGDGSAETARYWYEQLDLPPRFPGPRWARRVRAVTREAESLGFGLPPRRVVAFGAHPALAHDYLRCATFKAWMVTADDTELAEPPPPAPWPISDDARARVLPAPLCNHKVSGPEPASTVSESPRRPTSTATVQAASRHARRSRSRKIVDAHHRFTPAQLTSSMKLMSSCIGLFERSRKNVVVPLAFRIWSMACVNGTSTGGSLA